jgi:hypothetical protein
MGYFSNGTEGLSYELHFCSRCIHGDGESAGDCPIWSAHLLKNYEECNNPASILHMLIPLSADHLHNEQCRLFHPSPVVKRAAPGRPQGQAPARSRERD